MSQQPIGNPVTIGIPPPSAPPVQSVGGPMYRSSPTGSPYGPTPTPWTYRGPTAIIGGMPSTPTAVPSGPAAQVSAINSGVSSLVNDILGGLNSGIRTVTTAGAEFSNALDAAIQPLTQSTWELGQSISTLGYIGLAFDKKNKLGTSRIVDWGERMSRASGNVSRRSSSINQRMSTIASGGVNFDPVATGAERYQELMRRQEEEEKKKRRASQSGSTSSQRTAGGFRRAR